jgi:hypothetical protein
VPRHYNKNASKRSRVESGHVYIVIAQVVATGGRRNHFKIGIKELIKA